MTNNKLALEITSHEETYKLKLIKVLFYYLLVLLKTNNIFRFFKFPL